MSRCGPLMLIRHWIVNALILMTALFALDAVVWANAGQELRGALRAYENLVQELDLNSLPGKLRGYASVTEGLDRLGERLENLSRRVLRANEMAAEELTALQADIGQLSFDLAALRRQAFPLRLWSYLNNHDYPQPTWGVGLADSLTLSRPNPLEADGEVGLTLDLTAARGEMEAAQLLVISFGKQLSSVAVSCRGLRGKGAGLPGALVTCQPVRYAALPENIGEWPEALLPPGPVSVPGDSLQALWLSVTVPATQQAGLYEGDVVIKPEGMGAIRVRLRLRVWDFLLPVPRSLSLQATSLPDTQVIELAQSFGLGWVEGLAEVNTPSPVSAAAWRLSGWQAWVQQRPLVELAPEVLVRRGEDGLLPTVALASLRDAADDHAMLLLAAARETQDTALVAALAQARALVAAPPGPDTAQRLLALRRQIGDLLSLSVPEE